MVGRYLVSAVLFLSWAAFELGAAYFGAMLAVASGHTLMADMDLHTPVEFVLAG